MRELPSPVPAYGCSNARQAEGRRNKMSHPCIVVKQTDGEHGQVCRIRPRLWKNVSQAALVKSPLDDTRIDATASWDLDNPHNM